MNKRNQRTYVIIGLCAILVIMGIGYAAFSTLLTINGTANITNSWCVGFDNTKTNTKVITKGISTGTEPTGTMTYSGTACSSTLQPVSNLASVFYQPGDQIEYTLTIQNASTVPVAIKSILIDEQSVNSNTTITKGNVQYIVEMPASTNIAVSGTTTMKVTAKFQNDTDVVGPYAGNETQTIQVKINAEQGDGTDGMDVIRPLTPSGLIDNVVTSGDGLYADSTESGRYIYRGANPDNYITFNGETAGWRIISVESDGTMKIVRNYDASFQYPWDVGRGYRDSSTSTYCTSDSLSSKGCNAWAATSNLVGTPSVFTVYSPNGNAGTDATVYSGTVVKDSYLNAYLNETYYTSTLGTDRGYIVLHNFYIGTPGDLSDNESIALDYQQEKSYSWTGKVGLIQATDFLKATTNSGCTSINSGMACGSNNWLTPPSNSYWTISLQPESGREMVLTVSGVNGGNISNGFSNIATRVRPSVFLASTIHLKGDGTSGSPYYIDEE